MENTQARDIGGIVRQLREGGPDERSLAERVENLGLHDWEVWAGELASAAEVVAGGARLTVLNLSGFQDPYEPVAVSLDLVERLWAQRETRTPTLIVLDEAHNICPSVPQGSMPAAVVERLIQIAAEGRRVPDSGCCSRPSGLRRSIRRFSLAVRQPRAHADELARRHCRADGGVRVRPAGDAAVGAVLRAGSRPPQPRAGPRAPDRPERPPTGLTTGERRPGAPPPRRQPPRPPPSEAVRRAPAAGGAPR